MQTDPIGTKDQVNLYAYVGNDPLNGVDPAGSEVVSCVTVIESDGTVSRNDCKISDNGSDRVTIERVVSQNAMNLNGDTKWRQTITTESTNKTLSDLIKAGILIPVALPAPSSTRSLPSPRQSLLSRAQDPRVGDLVDNLYRKPARTGSGSSMDAYRAEGSHLEKLEGRRKQMQNLLKDRSLSTSDRQIVKELYNDLLNALEGR